MFTDAHDIDERPSGRPIMKVIDRGGHSWKDVGEGRWNIRVLLVVCVRGCHRHVSVTTNARLTAQMSTRIQVTAAVDLRVNIYTTDDICQCLIKSDTYVTTRHAFSVSTCQCQCQHMSVSPSTHVSVSVNACWCQCQHISVSVSTHVSVSVNTC